MKGNILCDHAKLVIISIICCISLNIAQVFAPFPSGLHKSNSMISIDTTLQYLDGWEVNYFNFTEGNTKQICPFDKCKFIFENGTYRPDYPKDNQYYMEGKLKVLSSLKGSVNLKENI